jgi:hypothetical protein
MSDYWVVGATWDGKGEEDQSKKFISRGYWYLGWPDEEQPAQAKRREQMKPGDRIAIKKMLGRGATQIEIRALGIIREVETGENDHTRTHVYVDWLVPKLNRKVDCNGCLATVHGPFKGDDQWVKQVFCI